MTEMKKAKYSKGFTLIELLIVIAIIGILASVVLIGTNAARGKSKDARVLSSVRQMRSVLESNYLGGSYADLTASPTNIATVGSGPGVSDLVSLIHDIGQQNGNNNAVTIGGVNVDFFSDGSAVQVGPGLGNDTGVTIFTTNTGGLATDYAIYATTTSGYVCIDSIGNVKTGGMGTVNTVPTSGGHVVCQ